MSLTRLIAFSEEEEWMGGGRWGKEKEGVVVVEVDQGQGGEGREGG